MYSTTKNMVGPKAAKTKGSMRNNPLPNRSTTRRKRQSQLRPIMHMRQPQNLRHIQLHRVLDNPQLTGNLIIGLPLAHQPRHIQLPRRQLIENRRDLQPVRLADLFTRNTTEDAAGLRRTLSRSW